MSTLSTTLLHHFQLDATLYSCRPEDHQFIPPSRPFWGLWFFLSGLTILLFYIPCIIAIASSDLLRTPAYKTMLVLGVFDVSSTFTHSLATGVLGFFGVKFCDYPRLIYCLGALALGSWMGCCATGMVLAVIRICDFRENFPLKVLFTGKRIYFYLLASFGYGLYAAFWTNPVIFTSVYMSWFFDPMVGKNPDLYTNWAHTLNNIIVVAVTTILYTLLGYLVMRKSRSHEQFSKYQITCLLQTFFFCFFHAVSSAMYAYMQFFAAGEMLILVVQVSWQISSGAVCLVYLTLNKTLRNSVLRMCCPKAMYRGALVAAVENQQSSQFTGTSGQLMVHRASL